MNRAERDEKEKEGREVEEEEEISEVKEREGDGKRESWCVRERKRKNREMRGEGKDEKNFWFMNDYPENRYTGDMICELSSAV